MICLGEGFVCLGARLTIKVSFALKGKQTLEKGKNVVTSIDGNFVKLILSKHYGKLNIFFG